MPRVTRGPKARRRRNRILKAASGYRGKRNSAYRIANESVMHAWQHMYRARRQRKRDFRRLWITRINAAVRPLGASYSVLMGALKSSDIELNRKMLSELAITDPASFKAVVQTATGAHG